MIKHIQKSLITLLIIAFPGISSSASMTNHDSNVEASSQIKVLQCANKKALKRNLSGEKKAEGNTDSQLLGNRTFSYRKGDLQSFAISNNNESINPEEIIESHYSEDETFLNFSFKAHHKAAGKSGIRYDYYQVMRTDAVVRHSQFIAQNIDITLSNDKRKMKNLLVDAAANNKRANDNELVRYLYIFECGT